MIDPNSIRARFLALEPRLNENEYERRRFAATEARSAGRGGIMAVFRATGIARSTIRRGLRELDGLVNVPPNGKRRPGGRRRALIEIDPTVLDDLLALLSPSERNDPMSPLRSTCKSLRRLTSELRAMGHQISHTTVAKLLTSEDFSLKASRNTREDPDQPNSQKIG